MKYRLLDLARGLFRRPTRKVLKPVRRPSLGVEQFESRDLPSTVVYGRDFEPTTSAVLAPGVTASWSSTTKSTSPSGQTFLGQFSNSAVTLTLNNLPAHGGLTIEFDLYLLKSWDGNDPLYGQDKWGFQIDGATQVDATFRNARYVLAPTAGQDQSYSPGTPLGGGPFASGFGAAAINTLGYTYTNPAGTQAMDSTYHFNVTVPHGATSLALTFTGSGLQGVSDESWGIDNVVVATGPSPTTSLTSDANPSVVGEPVTLTSTVAVPPGMPAATGAVKFFEGSTLLGTAPLVGGVAALSVSGLAVGSHPVVAVYQGDSVYGTSTSPVLTQTVDPVTVSVLATDDALVSGLVPGRLAFYRSGPTDQPLTVSYTVAGSAAAGVEYVPLAGSVTFGAGQAQVEIDVTPTGTSLASSPKSVVVALGSGSEWAADESLATAQVNIWDSGGVVGIESVDSSATEEGDGGLFRIYRTGPLDSDLVVNLGYTGLASNGLDYDLPLTVVIPFGESEVLLPLVPLDDDQDEGTEDVQVQVLPAFEYWVSPAAASAVAFITEAADEAPSVRIRGSLGFANWEGAYSLDAATDQVEVKNFNWIDQQKKSFAIEVTDRAANDPTKIDTVIVTFSTTNPEAKYNEAPRTLTLTETGADTGVFKSAWFAVVASAADDAFAPAGTTENGAGDRTFLAQFGGSLVAKYTSAAGANPTEQTASEKLNPLKTLTVNIQTLTETRAAGSAKVVADADVKKAMDGAREFLAQVGIALNFSAIGSLPPPVGYDPTTTPLAVATIQDAGGGVFIVKPTLTAADILARGLTASTAVDIEVFIVQDISAGGPGTLAGGFALSPNVQEGKTSLQVLDITAVNSVIMSKDGIISYSTLAHEILHVFGLPHMPSTDKPVETYSDADEINRVTNLMAPKGNLGENVFLGQRRLWYAQIDAVLRRTNPNFKLLK